MNKILYANGGFYPLADREMYEAVAAWPSSGIEITQAERDDLLAGERAGMRITLGPTGRPILVEPTPALPVVPTSVSPRQARLALYQTGRLQEVMNLIALADEPTKISWDFATSFERNSPIVLSLAASLNLTTAELDELFTLAAAL